MESFFAVMTKEVVEATGCSELRELSQLWQREARLTPQFTRVENRDIRAAQRFGRDRACFGRSAPLASIDTSEFRA
jgi:hypothetical protein